MVFTMCQVTTRSNSVEYLVTGFAKESSIKSEKDTQEFCYVLVIFKE